MEGSRELHGQDLEGRQVQRSPRGTAHHVRVGHQFENRESPRPCNSGLDPGAGRCCCRVIHCCPTHATSAIAAVARRPKTVGLMRSAAVLKLLVVVVAGTSLGIALTAHAAGAWNIGYRRLDLRDPVTGELFPVALWYPTHAASTPLFLTDS